MKNKKLLTRIFALLASLVLVVALALPCFADSAPQTPDISEAVRIESLDDLLFLMDDDSLNGKYYPVDIRILDFSEIYYSGTIHIGEETIEIYASYSSSTPQDFVIAHCIVEGVPDGELNYQSYGYYSSSPVGSEISFTDSFDLITDMIIYDVYTETSPTDSGWYGDIKSIIKDAVFGENASLDDSQQFTLNQISLWLTIIVILLPLIVVAVIVVRCFR